MKKLKNTLIVVRYNPEWVHEFELIRDFIAEQIGDLVIEIKHVGSTSVPGLAAKPIIDIVAIMESYEFFPQIVKRLEAAGFVYTGNGGIKDREVFKRLIPDEFMDYHFYVYPKNNEENRRQTIFRNALLNNKDIADEYGKLKMRLIDEVNGDRVKYTDSKTDFILGVIRGSEIPEIIIAGDRINIRTACLDDLKFINDVEIDKDNSPWVGNWNFEYRISKFNDGDFLQTILEQKNGTPIGFIIFKDMLMKNEQIQLKRIALSGDYKRRGYGREALYLVQKLAFEIFGTEKLYLSTKEKNIRAQNIYKATGFTADEPDPCVHFHVTREQYFKDKE